MTDSAQPTPEKAVPIHHDHDRKRLLKVLAQGPLHSLHEHLGPGEGTLDISRAIWAINGDRHIGLPEALPQQEQL